MGMKYPIVIDVIEKDLAVIWDVVFGTQNINNVLYAIAVVNHSRTIINARNARTNTIAMLRNVANVIRNTVLLKRHISVPIMICICAQIVISKDAFVVPKNVVIVDWWRLKRLAVLVVMNAAVKNVLVLKNAKNAAVLMYLHVKNVVKTI